MLSRKPANVQLGAAIASAMRDAVNEWAREHPGDGAIGERAASELDRIDVVAQVKIGGPMTLVVECIAHRPGRSSLFSYVLERSPKEKVLFRRHAST